MASGRKGAAAALRTRSFQTLTLRQKEAEVTECIIHA